jgi:hypothetical protein
LISILYSVTGKIRVVPALYFTLGIESDHIVFYLKVAEFSKKLPEAFYRLSEHIQALKLA